MQSCKYFRQILLIAAVTWCVLPPERPAKAADERPSRLLLLGQKPDGHPRLTHEYSAAMRLLSGMLSPYKDIQTIQVSADEPWKEGPELLDGADAAVVFVSEGAKWLGNDKARLKAFQQLAKRQGGLVCLHWGMGTRDAEYIEHFVDLFGGCHGGPDRKYKVVTVTTEFPNPQHPIMSAVKPLRLKEEFYYTLKTPKNVDNIVPLVRVPIDGATHTVGWAWERPDGGRSFGFSGLHFHQNWKHDAYRRMVTQAVLWSLKREIPKHGVDVKISPDILTISEK